MMSRKDSSRPRGVKMTTKFSCFAYSHFIDLSGLDMSDATMQIV